MIDQNNNSRPILISAKRIADSFYYIDWWEMDDYQGSVNYEKNIGEAITTLEKLYDAKMLLYWESEDENAADNIEILYASENFGTLESFEDIGLTTEKINSKAQNLTVGKTIYTATYKDLRIYGRNAKAVILLNSINNNTYIINCIVIAVGFMIICISAMILYFYWVDDYMQDHDVLTESQQKAWQRSQLRRKATTFGMNGALMLFLLTLGYQLLGNLSRISQSNQVNLDMMMARLEDSSRLVESSRREEGDWGIYYAGKIASLYSYVSDEIDSEFLKKVNDRIGSEFIMIFDGDGKEILSSNGYVGFKLGKDTEEDFAYLLQGIEMIRHDPEVDPFTGKTLQTMGVRMDLGSPDSCGAVILAIDPAVAWESEEKQEIEEYLSMLTKPENLHLIISRENDKVVYTSDMDLLDKESVEFGLDLENLQPVSLETFEISGIKQYSAYNRDDKYHYFFMTKTDSGWIYTLKFSAFSAIYFLIVCFFICVIMLGVPRKSAAEITKETQQFMENLKQKPSFSVREGTKEVFQEEKRGDRSVKEWWNDLTPEKRIVQLLKLIATIVMIAVFVFLLGQNELEGNSVINFILHGSWKREVNELSIAAIIILVFYVLLLILVKNIILQILRPMVSAKGRTIISMISSLFEYIVIIVSFFICLSYVGFDTGLLITSASILSLAISLGSKDLVADIISGIFIIFEDDFHIGDHIEVNGFKGKVLDIGVRSTKLINSSGNIKSIDNQNMKNITNYSKEDSRIFINLKISNTQSLDEIEAMLNRELPKVKDQIPEIKSGPHYFGVNEIGYHWVQICISALADQNDVNNIISELNRVLYDIFEKNGFRL